MNILVSLTTGCAYLCTPVVEQSYSETFQFHLQNPLFKSNNLKRNKSILQDDTKGQSYFRNTILISAVPAFKFAAVLTSAVKKKLIKNKESRGTRQFWK